MFKAAFPPNATATCILYLDEKKKKQNKKKHFFVSVFNQKSCILQIGQLCYYAVGSTMGFTLLKVVGRE